MKDDVCWLCGGCGYWYDDDALDDGTEDYYKVTCNECDGAGHNELTEQEDA